LGKSITKNGLAHWTKSPGAAKGALEFHNPNSNKGKIMGIIGSSLKPFATQSYKDGKFVEVSDADVKGKWGVFFFYPADFTFRLPDRAGRPGRPV
jgi:hypothetical protein